MSSCCATCGKSSLTSIPDWPYFLNANGDASAAAPVLRSVGRSRGIACPLYFCSAGFGSKVSTCEGPPFINRKMTPLRPRRQRRVASGEGLNAFPACGAGPEAKADSPRTPISPSAANPFPIRPSSSRRERNRSLEVVAMVVGGHGETGSSAVVHPARLDEPGDDIKPSRARPPKAGSPARQGPAVDASIQTLVAGHSVQAMSRTAPQPEEFKSRQDHVRDAIFDANAGVSLLLQQIPLPIPNRRT